MGILDETRFVERLRFFDGQRLLASDLQGIEAFHSEMRWLHNRSFHQPGIGNGYAVTGERDAREIRIGPGYALDALGREIVLTHEQVEPIPPVAGEVDGQSVFYDLVVSYDEDPEASETRQGICADRGVIRLREEPVLCFVRLVRDANGNLKPADDKLGKEIQDGLRIILARLEVIDCRLRDTISLAQRRSARPARLPFIACGETPIPNNDDVFENPNDNVHILYMEIDTSAAGFQSPPCYSVRLDRVRVQKDFYILDSSPQILEPKAKSFIVSALFRVVSIDSEDATETTPSPVLDAVGPNAAVLPDPEGPRDGWTAFWMGVE
jgi:hypothetical protein